MLHKETVAPATLALLVQLMQLPELGAFALVGGTNLSLQFGHRISVDIDLFTHQPFNANIIHNAILGRFGSVVKTDETRQSACYTIEGIKVDVVLHEYKYLQPVAEIEGIRMVAVPDIIPMKLGAVAGRGAKKDFWDVAELLDHFTIEQMLQLYVEKYETNDTGFVLRSLVYFDDAELQSDPVALKNTSWEAVKCKIESAVKEFVYA